MRTKSFRLGKTEAIRVAIRRQVGTRLKLSSKFYKPLQVQGFIRCVNRRHLGRNALDFFDYYKTKVLFGWLSAKDCQSIVFVLNLLQKRSVQADLEVIKRGEKR